jgi:ArsR family transcriptional regulator
MTRRTRGPRLPERALELIAARFKALSEPSRLKLIMSLEAGERNVTQLVGETGLTQANVSRHLHVLVEAGILTRRKDGLAVIYGIADPTIVMLCDQVCRGLQRRVEKEARAFRR